MDCLDLRAIQVSLKSLLQHHSSKASILWCSAFSIVRLSHPYMTTGKTIALTRRTFVGKVMSLLFNMLSRLVITFLPKSKHLLISWLLSPSAVILEPPKIKELVNLIGKSKERKVIVCNQDFRFWVRRAKPLSRDQGCLQLRFLLLEPSCLSHRPGACNPGLTKPLQLPLTQTSLLLLPLTPVLLSPSFFDHWGSLCCFNYCLNLEKTGESHLPSSCF